MKNLLAKILGISSAVLNFLLPILKSAIAGSLERLLPLALQIVTELAVNNQLGNAEKRGVAVSRLADAAKAEGITASVSLVNFAIEAAVQKLKAN